MPDPLAAGGEEGPAKIGRAEKKDGLSLFWLLSPQRSSNCSITRPTGTMGSKLTDKKRKAREPESESDNELANGLFDGVLSQSEDEEDYIPSDDDNVDDSESDSEGTDASEDEEDEEEDGDDILSDDIPSDVDDENEIDKLVKQHQELEITEPGVDPKPRQDDGEERNYRIEKDANGGERYVYECVLQWVMSFSGSGWINADLVPTVRSTPSTTRTTRTPRVPSTQSEIFP